MGRRVSSGSSRGLCEAISPTGTSFCSPRKAQALWFVVLQTSDSIFKVWKCHQVDAFLNLMSQIGFLYLKQEKNESSGKWREGKVQNFPLILPLQETFWKSSDLTKGINGSSLCSPTNCLHEDRCSGRYLHLISELCELLSDDSNDYSLIGEKTEARVNPSTLCGLKPH